MFPWGWGGVGGGRCLVNHTQARCSLVPGSQIRLAGGLSFCSLGAWRWGAGWVHRKFLSWGMRPSSRSKEVVCHRKRLQAEGFYNSVSPTG